MILRFAGLLLFLGSIPLHAEVRDTTFQFPLPLLDIGIRAGTNDGVILVAAPSLRSKQGADSTVAVFLTFHPDSLVSWLNHAVAVLRQTAVTAPTEQIQWSRDLRSVRGSGHFALGRTVKQGKLRGERWLAIADSLRGWTLKLSGKEADSLLALLFAAGTQAGLGESKDSPLPVDSVDVPVQIRHQPIPGNRGVIGRVLTQYVVDIDGRVDPATVVILLASSPILVDLARETLLGSRFTPAFRGGRPVRQLVQQAMLWRPR
jgi:hypothetical protein